MKLTDLKIQCLTRVPLTFETVNEFYEQIFGRGYTGDVAVNRLIEVILSHERLRAELEGAETLLEGMKNKDLVDWVCVGCGARFKHIPHDDTVQHCTPCVTVHAQAELIDQLRQNVKLLHDATIIARRSLMFNDPTSRGNAIGEINRLVDQVQP